MLIDAALTLKTSDGLRAALQAAANHKLTASELLDQRVSFVYGNISKENGLTKEQVRQMLVGQTEGSLANQE